MTVSMGGIGSIINLYHHTSKLYSLSHVYLNTN